MTIDATTDYARIPAILSFPDTTGFAETYGFGAASGRVWLEGQYLVPSERASKTLYLFTHPANAGGARRRRLARPVRREPLSEERQRLIMEKVAIDMAAWVKDARVRGYEKVILVGWSGATWRHSHS